MSDTPKDADGNSRAFTEAELLPCPFCGGRAKYERAGTFRQSCIVACRNCGCRHESSDEDWTNGYSWNHREFVPSVR